MEDMSSQIIFATLHDQKRKQKVAKKRGKSPLGGGFKHFVCSSLFGEDEPILTSIFFKGGWFNHQLALISREIQVAEISSFLEAGDFVFTFVKTDANRNWHFFDGIFVKGVRPPIWRGHSAGVGSTKR